MQERIKQIPKKIMEFWNKYTNKQKTIIICVVAAIFLTIVLLTYIFTRPKFETKLASFEDNKQSSELVDLLKNNSIEYTQSKDGLTVYVQEKDYTPGLNLMAENNILSDEWSWEDAYNNSMSTTEKEKEQKRTLAKQTTLRSYIMKYQGVKDATVYLNQPDVSYTVFDDAKEASVSIMLSLEKEMTAKEARSIALWVANAVGNKSTDNIVIMDQDRNLLFGGGSGDVLGGEVSDKEDYKQKLRNTISEDVKSVLLNYGFDAATIGSSNIKFDFNKVTERYTEYTPAADQEQGVYSHSYEYESQGTSSSGGVPGTATNGDLEADYTIDSSGSNDSKVKQNKYDYLPNERVTKSDYEIGAVKPEESSIAVVATRYKVYNEEDVDRQGLLNGITFQDFIDQNNTRIATNDDVNQITNLVAQTTGIDPANISVVTWEVPIFNAKETTPFDFTNYLMIILAVLIIALLIFVVFKGTAPVEVTEMEPELSVEQLLATTKENQSLEDIEFSDKSETRKMIEKFVDENPEAVANLLRNWLQEDWG